jgi:dihydroorotate dehydrogenase
MQQENARLLPEFNDHGIQWSQNRFFRLVFLRLPMYSLLRELMFCLPTETSHDLALTSLSLAEKCHLSGLLASSARAKPVSCFGLVFPNPVGLAAGLDKNADHIDGLAALGFGFIEVGTVTPRPQAGNPQPRLFRLPKAQAIINRMGFNNLGVDHLVAQVRASKFYQQGGIIGINIGKNKDTPAERAADDYVICMDKVYELASYITVNLSSPNTPGLRDLQFGEPLRQLLAAIKQKQNELVEKHRRYVPVLVKIAPDMALEDLTDVANALMEFSIDGVIATNTTISRDAVKTLPHGEEAGGLSGAPLTQRSTEVVRQLKTIVGDRLPIIVEKQNAGASLVQIYSGFIYRGPQLIEEGVLSWRS